MTYQYLYGDSYKTFDDKRKLERAQIKKYQDLFITPEVANNATAIKESNPTLSPGVISSLAYVDATAEDVQIASLEQAKINAQTHKNHITQVPSSLATPNVQTALIGKPFEIIGEGMEEGWSLATEGFRRTIRGIFQTWTGGFEELYTRNVRANIMLTGELEQTLQDEYNLTPEEAQKIGNAWQLAGLLTPQQNRPGTTLRNPDTGEELTAEEIKELRKNFQELLFLLKKANLIIETH